eukprot:gnl/TRDRNA2_/TRDRNA2_177964_c2_seq16.p1 gnl/TRDRNA2_/TRDRNA2_177964_c2~~gnl/TRDRNA2_/TRDRNA2_177964_c2_seq16.p1  ORF type:complete len:226 (+),score=41.96 gnl/TRDRNA2_/TRDRNA2_177964_c2_seq16:35-679(+)
MCARVAFMHMVLGEQRMGPAPKYPNSQAQLNELRTWLVKGEKEMEKASKEGFASVFKKTMAATDEQEKDQLKTHVSGKRIHLTTGGAMVKGFLMQLDPLDQLLTNFEGGCPTLPKGGIVLRGNRKKSKNPACTSGSVSKDTRRHWATPRHGHWGTTRVLTARSVRDLQTQLIFAEDQKDSGSDKLIDECYPNPRFIEWMMGYPAAWTEGLWTEA